jgi:hypothetical protein
MWLGQSAYSVVHFLCTLTVVCLCQNIADVTSPDEWNTLLPSCIFHGSDMRFSLHATNIACKGSCLKLHGKITCLLGLSQVCEFTLTGAGDKNCMSLLQNSLVCGLKVILSPIFRDCMKWSYDGNLTNQMSQFLFMFTDFAYKTSHFYSPW